MATFRKLTAGTQLTSLPDSGYHVLMFDSSGNIHRIPINTFANGMRGSIKVGMRNYLVKSNVAQSKNDQIMIGSYNYGSERPTINDTYTLSVCYSLQGTNIRGCMFSGSIYYPFTFTENGERLVRSVTVAVGDCGFTPSRFDFYRANLDDRYPATIHWAVLTRGTVGVTEWMAAPEDLSGGGKARIYNRLPISRFEKVERRRCA